jgi:prefoldin subunit 5
MTEIEELKSEGFNLFCAREQLQMNLMQINQRLQEITNSIQQIEKVKADGNSKED